MPQDKTTGAEEIRLADDAARKANWKRWGPYVSERQWDRCARIIPPTGRAEQLPPIMRAAGRIAGARMGCWAL